MADITVDPFAATGGGVKLPGGEWVPKDHPLAAGAMTTAPTTAPPPPPGAPPPPSGTPAPTQAGNIPQQAQNASTYSQVPGAAPNKYTANQGSQDVVRNSYLQQATQGTQIDRNDPNFRQQADAFASGVERQQRNYLADRAEQLGPYATGAMRGEQRMAAEQSGRAIGGFEAELVGRELTNRRDEIQRSLTALTGILGSDQQAQLQRELAALEAEIRKLGINTDKDVALKGQALQKLLGMEGLDLDWARLSAQKDQFSDDLGLRLLQEQNRNDDYWGG